VWVEIIIGVHSYLSPAKAGKGKERQGKERSGLRGQFLPLQATASRILSVRGICNDKVRFPSWRKERGGTTVRERERERELIVT
jgi:hypothetical protein